MTHRDDREQGRLKEFFRQVHQDPAPPFETFLNRSGQSKVLGWRWAVAATAAVAMVVTILLVLESQPSRPVLVEEEALALASSISSWEGPLDFLLDTPASETFEAPTLLAPIPEIPSTTDVNNKENSS